MTARYAHTNLIARDWQRLARFYQDVFGCQPILPERDLSGDWLDKATGIDDAHSRGIHLRLPGYGDDGPTLEIFHYEGSPERAPARPNTPGLAHIAFVVDDVAAYAQLFVNRGGTVVGELVTLELASVGVITFQYLADPEGNIVEVQRVGRDGHQASTA